MNNSKVKSIAKEGVLGKTNVGVIVGRFQVPRIHDGHKHLIQTALDENDRVIIIVGCTGGQTTDVDPYDFVIRNRMIKQSFPDERHVIDVVSFYDRGDDVAWSKGIDVILDDLVAGENATMYGSRDSFINQYVGKHPCRAVESVHSVSGTEMRNSLEWEHIENVEEALKGIALAAKSRYPVAYQTVDVAVLSKDETKVLLGRKDQEKNFRFIGGFVDPGESLEQAALRELGEETGGDLVVTKPVYVGSAAIDDIRYRRSRDGITTTFFAVTHQKGKAKANDDIVEVKWVDLNSLNDVIVGTHKALAILLQNYVTNKKVLLKK